MVCHVSSWSPCVWRIGHRPFRHKGAVSDGGALPVFPASRPWHGPPPSNPVSFQRSGGRRLRAAEPSFAPGRARGSTKRQRTHLSRRCLKDLCICPACGGGRRVDTGFSVQAYWMFAMSRSAGLVRASRMSRPCFCAMAMMVRMAQRVRHPLHRPAARPCPTRPQAQPRAARSPDTPPAMACLPAPADAQPGLIRMLHARPARRQRLDRDARPPQTPRGPDAQRRQCRRRHPRPEQHRQDIRQMLRRQKLRMTQPRRRPRKTRTVLRRGRHAQREHSRRATAAPVAAAPDKDAPQPRQHTGTWSSTRSGGAARRSVSPLRPARPPRLAPRLLPQAPRPTPGRRLRKPVAQGRLAAVAALQPKAALQHRYPLDKTRPLLPKHRVPCLQARNLLLQTPGYRPPTKALAASRTRSCAGSFMVPTRTQPADNRKHPGQSRFVMVSMCVAHRPSPFLA